MSKYKKTKDNFFSHLFRLLTLVVANTYKTSKRQKTKFPLSQFRVRKIVYKVLPLFCLSPPFLIDRQFLFLRNPFSLHRWYLSFLKK